MSIRKKQIRPGALVMVSYPMYEYEQTTNPAKKFEGQEFTVKRRVHVTRGKGGQWYWELYGAVSDKGVPYGFLDDELYVIAEAKSCH